LMVKCPVKCPLVSIVAHTDYATPGSGAHLHFHGLEPAVGLCPVLWTVDDTSSITCRYLPSRRTYLGRYSFSRSTEGRRLGGWPTRRAVEFKKVDLAAKSA